MYCIHYLVQCHCMNKFLQIEVVPIKPDAKEADVQAVSVTFAMDYRNELVGLAMELDFFQSRRVLSE